MPSGNTLEKPRKKTGGFASRLLHKQLEERTKKSSYEFSKPATTDAVASESKQQSDKVTGN